jgi:hypothetical protein
MESLLMQIILATFVWLGLLGIGALIWNKLKLIPQIAFIVVIILIELGFIQFVLK